jgi:hypothetical protein
MKKRINKRIIGLITYLIVCSVFIIHYYFKHNVWNWDYFMISFIGILSYTVVGFIIEKTIK